jgi:transposase
MDKTRRQYTREFKLEAVRLSEDPDRSAASVARELGIKPKLLYRWRQELLEHANEAFPGHGRRPESEEAVRQLERELERVTQERDILKKAIAIFSRER